MKKILETYGFKSEAIPVVVTIYKTDKDYVPTYELRIPGISEGTKLLLTTKFRGELMSEIDLDISEILDPKKSGEVRKRFFKVAIDLLKRSFKELNNEKASMLATYLVQNTLGLGELEVLLFDNQLEEIVINGSTDYIWVYQKKFGWCKTNIRIKSEEKIYNYAALIARKVGRQINILNPLLDAHLSTGERVNATLFPISTYGNTITIRKFSKNPWTVTTLLANKTVDEEVLSLIWLMIQNELSLLVSGGTGSGKTSFLNAIAGFIPPNQRIISIEDTRELTLPSFLQWVPMVTREPNPEGKGEVSMLDLLVNSLRMRPDRIIVGEVRRKREAEVMFEAMHTGHSVYATLHADNASQTISRLTTPPIELPPQILDALAGVVVQLRHRRFNIRRTLEFAEIKSNGGLNTIYRWDAKLDKIQQINPLERTMELLELYAGFTKKEVVEDIEEKKMILRWMVNKKYFEVDKVGHIISSYYNNPSEVIKVAKSNKNWVFQ